MSSASPTRLTVRPLAAGDRPSWDRLWAGYLRFYRETLAPDVSAASFARLVARERGSAGLVAVLDGAVVGFAHVNEQWGTWSTASTLYLEDLFVDPAVRAGGVGRALIAAVYAEADARGCSRTYWVTEEFNAPARRLYETVARRLSQVVYER